MVAAHRGLALRLGAVGLMLHGWMQNMGTAEALLASGDLACSLRYEDLVERLTLALTLTLTLTP